MPESDMTGNIFLFGRSEAVSPAAERAQSAAPAPSVGEVMIEKICAGDEQAFGEFYRLYAPMVHSVVLARTAYDEVQDITQEVFLSAYRNIHTLRDKNAAGPWLAMIARNQVAEFYRRAKPSEELSEDLREDKRSQMEANEVLAAIRVLSDTYRETLIMRLVEGMTGTEIAERTGMSHESVRVNLYRGMKLLREKLGIGDK
jgi:RNA polymerase sigma-70 factor, ECF subfamily